MCVFRVSFSASVSSYPNHGVIFTGKVGADNVAKIADFGISKFVKGSEQRLQEQVG